MNREEAIVLATQHLESLGRRQELAGATRIGADKLKAYGDELRNHGENTLAEKLINDGPHWAIHFKIAKNCEESVECPAVNIVSVFDNGKVSEMAVL